MSVKGEEFNEDGDEAERGRVIAIVGRPNVGKSALFNRMIRRRMAIVHERAGVTRDRLAVQVTFGDERFELVDTGGIGLFDDKAAPDVIEAGIITQVETALQDASALLFVVDASLGVQALDREVARRIRECGIPVFLAANKCDDGSHDHLADEFEELNFPVYAVSALHGRGISQMIEDALATLPEGEVSEPEDALRVAIVGRPNAGKSSYINRLIHEERLIVSEIPGTTRDSINVPFSVGKGKGERHYVFIDTAGVRRPGKIKDVVEKFSIMRTDNSIKRAAISVLVLDASEGPKMRDKKIAGLIDKYNKGCVILVNKWDLADGITTQKKYGEALVEVVPFFRHVPIIFASTLSGFNMRRTLDAIDFVATQVDKEISTGLLNRTILDLHAKTPPPMVRNHRLRIYYVTQVGTRPVRIKLFCNDPSRRTPQYESFIKNQLRKKYGFEGAPIVLLWVARPKKDLDDD